MKREFTLQLYECADYQGMQMPGAPPGVYADKNGIYQRCAKCEKSLVMYTELTSMPPVGLGEEKWVYSGDCLECNASHSFVLESGTKRGDTFDAFPKYLRWVDQKNKIQGER